MPLDIWPVTLGFWVWCYYDVPDLLLVSFGEALWIEAEDSEDGGSLCP